MKAKVGAMLLGAMLVVSGVQAESITHGGTTINMDFVDIGYAGNTADTTGYGAVGYDYRIGKYEVTADQWASVIAADSNVGDTGLNSGSQPTANSSWYEAAKFANWLTTGDAYTGAYQFDGSGTFTSVNRDAAVSAYGTVYVLPTEDEWYKAAYLKSDGSAYTTYATGNSIPIAGVGGENYNGAIGSPWNVGAGIAENNGTFDMNGNVFEWNESAFDSFGRVHRGGADNWSEDYLRSSNRYNGPPMIGTPNTGFRVAAIPEPSTVSLLGLSAVAGIMLRRRRTKTVTKIAPPSSDRFMEQW